MFHPGTGHRVPGSPVGRPATDGRSWAGLLQSCRDWLQLAEFWAPANGSGRVQGSHPAAGFLAAAVAWQLPLVFWPVAGRESERG